MTSYIGEGSAGAVFSMNRVYRYSLWRRWVDDCPPQGILAVIGLNPSTADETVNDPTVTRCIGYAKDWGYGGLVMLNLFALRATDPAVMKAHRSPVGLENDFAIIRAISETGRVLCAWGNHGSHRARDFEVKKILRLAREAGHKVYRFEPTNKDGSPKHPLYLPKTAELKEWIL